MKMAVIQEAEAYLGKSTASGRGRFDHITVGTILVILMVNAPPDTMQS